MGRLGFAHRGMDRVHSPSCWRVAPPGVRQFELRLQSERIRQPNIGFERADLARLDGVSRAEPDTGEPRNFSQRYVPAPTFFVNGGTQRGDDPGKLSSHTLISETVSPVRF